MNICVYAYKKCSRYIIIIIQHKKDAHIRKEVYEIRKYLVYVLHIDTYLIMNRGSDWARKYRYIL